jgi:hypothetical protein
MNQFFSFKDENHSEEVISVLQNEYSALPSAHFKSAVHSAVLFTPIVRQQGRLLHGAPRTQILSLARSYLEIMRKASVCAAHCSSRFQEGYDTIVGTFELKGLGEFVLFLRGGISGPYLFASSLTGGTYQVTVMRLKGLFNKRLNIEIVGSADQRSGEVVDAFEAYPDSFVEMISSIEGRTGIQIKTHVYSDEPHKFAPVIGDKGHAVVEKRYMDVWLRS